MGSVVGIGACDLRRYSPLVGVGDDEVGGEEEELDKMVAVVWVSRRRAGWENGRLRNQSEQPQGYWRNNNTSFS